MFTTSAPQTPAFIDNEIHLTRIKKPSGALLSKRISLGDNGELVPDGSPCRMTSGTAERVYLNGSAATTLARVIMDLGSHEALVTGDFAAEADQIQIELGAVADPAKGTFNRTKDTFAYPASRPAVALLDFDQKAMPADVRDRIAAAGGFEGALATLIPGYAGLERIVRASTSAGIYDKVTGKQFPSTGGLHVYLFVRDGVDIPRFLETLHKRAWLADYGWIMVAARGALLVRSIVDVSVGSPERLVFEGPPQLDPPLAQDPAARQPIAHDGDLLDTLAACPPLTAIEQRQYDAMVAMAKLAAKPQAEAAVEAAAEKIANDRSIPIAEARTVVRSSLSGALTSHDRLDFDDRSIGTVTVADVLADAERFHEQTLADPMEGPSYGRGKAKVYRCDDGSVVINSFAHGGGLYRLTHDAAFIEARMREAGEGAPFVLAGLNAQARDALDAVKHERLSNLAAKLGKVGKRAVKATIDDAVKEARRDAPARGDLEARERLTLTPATINKTAKRCAEVLADTIYLRGRFPSAVVRAGDIKPDAILDGVQHDKSTLVMVTATAGMVQYKLDERVTFLKRDVRSGTDVQVSCPKDLAQRLIDAATDMPFRQCSGIVTVPLFINGQIIAEPGYHAPTGRLIAFNGPLPPIPENPTKADALARIIHETCSVVA